MSSAELIHDADVRRRVRDELRAILAIQDDEDVLARLVSDAFVSADNFSQITTLSVATIYRRAKDDPSFPKPIKIDSRTVWLLSEVQGWMKQRVEMARA